MHSYGILRLFRCSKTRDIRTRMQKLVLRNASDVRENQKLRNIIAQKL